MRAARSLPWSAVALAGGVVFTLYLQAAVRPHVFTQGDLAMKFLYTRQLAEQGFSLEMKLPGEAWVKDLWSRGLHPFPFAVRQLAGREYLYYPVTFPLVSAPFYRLAGFRGLYLIPLASTWAVWLAFHRLARRWHLEEPWRGTMTALLVFATPLTFYSATFWEHSLAVALAFPPLAFALSPPWGAASNRWASIGLGATMGAAGWFREEMLFLAGITLVLLVLPRRLRLVESLSVRRWPFVAGLAVALALFVAANTMIYGMPLGLHAEEFVGFLSSWRRAADAARFLQLSLWHHYPLGLLFPVAAAGLWLRGKGREVLRPTVLLLVVLAFCVAVPLLARHEGGRQFGPRFLLAVFPLSLLAGGVLLQRAVEGASSAVRGVAVTALVLLAAAGVKANAVDGAEHLRVNYRRRLESYEAVRRAQPPIVAVSHEFVAQGLADLVGSKVFFRTPQAAQVKDLARELPAHGQERLLYVCYPEYPCGPFSGLPPEVALRSKGRLVVRFEKAGQFDRYVIYEGSVAADARP